jgi:hypothetical protein
LRRVGQAGEVVLMIGLAGEGAGTGAEDGERSVAKGGEFGGAAELGGDVACELECLGGRLAVLAIEGEAGEADSSQGGHDGQQSAGAGEGGERS